MKIFKNGQKSIYLNLYRIVGPPYNRNGLCLITRRFSSTTDLYLICCRPTENFFTIWQKCEISDFSWHLLAYSDVGLGRRVTYISSYADRTFICGSDAIGLQIGDGIQKIRCYMLYNSTEKRPKMSGFDPPCKIERGLKLAIKAFENATQVKS